MLEHRLGPAEGTGDVSSRRCIQCNGLEVKEKQYRTTYGANGREYKEPAAPKIVQALPDECPGPRFHWDVPSGEYVAAPRVTAFLMEIAAVCAKHCMTIAHEDSHGAFIVEPLTQENIDWLLDAHLEGVR